LGARVFSDPAARAQLGALTHPAVRAEMERQLALHAARGAPVVYLSVPLLYEGGLDAMVQHVVVIASNPENQLKRLMARENISVEDARRRIASQMPLEEKVRRAWRVIHNDGTAE